MSRDEPDGAEVEKCMCSLVGDENLSCIISFWGFPGGSDGKESACKAGDPGLIPGSGRSPGKGNGSPLQYFCLGNPTDSGAWRAIDQGSYCSRTKENMSEIKVGLVFVCLVS